MDALRFVEHCIDTYAERAWRMAYAMLSNVHDADDLLQQAFLIAWRKAESAPRENPWPWLAAIIAGEAYNARRKRSRRAAAPLDQAGDPAMQANQQRELEQAELHALVHLALNELSPEQRIAIVLTHLSGLTQEQAAKAVGVPLDTLKARVRRGMDKLREVVRTDDSRIEHLLLTLPAAFGAGGLVALKAGWVAGVQSEAALAATAGVAAGGTGKGLAFAGVALLTMAALLVGVLVMPADRPAKEPPQHDLAARKQSSTRPLSAHQAGDVAADDGNGSDAADLKVQDPPAEPANIGTPGEIGSINPWVDPEPKDTEPKDAPPPGPPSRYLVHRVFSDPSADQWPEPSREGLSEFVKKWKGKDSSFDKFTALKAAAFDRNAGVRYYEELLTADAWQFRAEIVRRIQTESDHGLLDALHRRHVGVSRGGHVDDDCAGHLLWGFLNNKEWLTSNRLREYVAAVGSDRSSGLLIYGGQLRARTLHEATRQGDGDQAFQIETVRMLADLHGTTTSSDRFLARTIETALEQMTGINATPKEIATLVTQQEFRRLEPKVERYVQDELEVRITSIPSTAKRDLDGMEVFMLPEFGFELDPTDPHLLELNRRLNLSLVSLPDNPHAKGVTKVVTDGFTEADGAFLIPIDKVVGAMEQRRAASGRTKVGIIAQGLGGWVAMEYMRRHPESVAFSVIIGTMTTDGYAKLQEDLAKSRRPELAALGRGMRHGDGLGFNAFSKAEAFDYFSGDMMRLHSDSRTAAVTLRAMRASATRGGRMLVPEFAKGKAPWESSCEVPVLFVGARLFPGISLHAKDQDRLVEQFTRRDSLSLSTTGLEPWAEDYDRFERDVDTFFKKHGLE